MTKSEDRPANTPKLGVASTRGLDALAGSHAHQDYLKAIYKLSDAGEAAATNAIAERLGVSPASASGMVKKLAAEGWVAHEPHRGVRLTEAGRLRALEMIRHHRLIELFLHKALGFSWDQVDAEAERLEHVLSEALEEAMARYLQDPVEDPHGDPIPSKEGVMPPTPRYASLAEALPGQRVRVRRVSDRDPALLRYLGELGLYPHVEVEVLGQAPFGGPLMVRVAGREHALGLPVTGAVYVEPVGVVA